jgi:hypothetical protein
MNKMSLSLERIEDKVEFFEAATLQKLEYLVNEKIDHNRALLLEVNHISHNVSTLENDKLYYTAVVHFKAKK